MNEENFDIPSEHNIKSVVKKAQLRGWRFRSSKLSSDKGSVKSEDRIEFGLDAQGRTSRIYNSVKGGILELSQLFGSSTAIPEYCHNEGSEVFLNQKSKFLQKKKSDNIQDNLKGETHVTPKTRISEVVTSIRKESLPRVVEKSNNRRKLKLMSMLDVDVEHEEYTPLTNKNSNDHDISICDVRAAI